MAKILVADDNSNVQKTVALALADLGVEVVAVNNGEAAVRKLADISPDLVLADIFMPVRNGYEVCEYVKKDSRFANVPVVLLVGAFDPLDEQEAQRVGADGILKKPFVPPDPLIAMVKTLLDRTLGDRLVTVAASKPVVSMQSKAGGVATAEEHPPAPEISEELPLEEFRPPVDRLSFGEGDAPIAFGELLETPTQESAPSGTGEIEPVGDDQILTSSRDSSLGDPVFWRTEEPKPETDEENSESENEADESSEPPMQAWTPDEEAKSRTDSDFLQPLEPEPFELVREEQDASGQTSTVVESTPLIAHDAASQASLTVEPGKPEDLAANPIEWMASAPPPPAEEIPEAAADWSAEATEASDSDQAGVLETSNFKAGPTPVAPSSISTRTPEPPPPPTPAQTTAKPIAQSAEDTAHSIPKDDWADLASDLQAKITEPVAEKAKASPIPVEQHPLAAVTSAEPAPSNSVPPVSKTSKQSAEDTARSILKQDWADLTAGQQPKPVEPFAEKSKPATPPVAPAPAVPAANTQPAPVSIAQPPAAAAANADPASANSALPGSPDPALVEAVVQRVLEKMRPQVVDIITKEFLRPVVQALVHREVTKR
ncbi:MAG: response regulator [Candidatus Acidiferrales bacterium]